MDRQNVHYLSLIIEQLSGQKQSFIKNGRHNTQDNDIQHNDIQYNETQHKDIQYNIFKNATHSITPINTSMLSDIRAGCQKLAIMLSVFMMNIAMLNVVASNK
jgi:hypothetical protein